MARLAKSRVDQAEKQFLNVAKLDAIDLTNPDVAGLWYAFKQFGFIPFDCEQTALLFECGIFAFEGREMFELFFVRQFTIHKDGEYDHMEQFHICMRFAPTPELRLFKVILWSSKFGSLQEFLNAVEGLETFSSVLRLKRPEAVRIYQDRI